VNIMTKRKKRHSPEQIVRKIQQADRILAEGGDVAAVLRELNITEATYYRWRKRSKHLHHQVEVFVERWHRFNSTSLAPADKGWTRTFITTGMAHYQLSPSKQSDLLLVGFSGRAGRLMMPTPDFLQSIQALSADLLILWARSGANYGQGIPGLGEDLRGSLEMLADHVESRGYSSVGVIGTSGGGVPAAIFALKYLPAPFILVGSSDPRKTTSARVWAEAVSQVSRNPSPPHGMLVVGEQAPKGDFDAADYLQSSLDIPVKTSPGNHSPLHLMAEEGRLGSFLRGFFPAEGPGESGDES
jgi:hypothetical protein